MIGRVAEAFKDGLASKLRSLKGHPPTNPDAGSDRIAGAVSDCLASRGQQGLVAELQEGISSLASEVDDVSVAVTGLGWLGSGVPALERTLTDLVTGANNEILVTAYSMTPGTGRVWESLENAIHTGIRCTLIANRIDDQHPELRPVLIGLARRYHSRFKLYDFHGDGESDVLHAKLVVVDRRAALVGSANLTYHGMMSAHELAVVIRGPTAAVIASRIDRLLQSTLVTEYRV
jgi:phosphatidylserine/phosphatidylglycerophosphate/cardiolipin synthase-like enzyme